MSQISGYDYGNPFKTYQTTTSATTTGNVNTNVLGSVLIPGGVFFNGDVVRCNAFFDRVGTGVLTLSLYWNTVPNITGGSPTLFAIFTGSSSSNTCMVLERNLFISATTGSNKTICGSTITTLTNDFYASSTVATSSVTIDWTIDGYVICTAKSATSSDTLNFRWAKVSRN